VVCSRRLPIIQGGLRPFHKLLSDCLTNPKRCSDQRFLTARSSLMLICDSITTVYTQLNPYAWCLHLMKGFVSNGCPQPAPVNLAGSGFVACHFL